MARNKGNAKARRIRAGVSRSQVYKEEGAVGGLEYTEEFERLCIRIADGMSEEEALKLAQEEAQ